jgi:hypothetical protein
MNASYANEALAQQGTPGEVGSGNKSEPYFPPLNLSGPETAQELQGNNSAILSEDTGISNPNNTALSSTGINERPAWNCPETQQRIVLSLLHRSIFLLS